MGVVSPVGFLGASVSGVDDEALSLVLTPLASEEFVSVLSELLPSLSSFTIERCAAAVMLM